MDSLALIVTPDIVDPLFANNINNFFSYLNYQTNEIYVYFPREQLKAKLKEVGSEVLENVAEVLLELPTCTEAELDEFERTSSLNCVPAESKQFITENYQDISTAEVEDFLNTSPFFEGEDNVALSQFAQQLNPDQYDPAQYVEFQKQAEIVRQSIAIAKLVLVLAWIVWICLIILFILLGTGNFLRRIKTSAAVTLVVGMLVSAAGVIMHFVLVPVLTSGLVFVPDSETEQAIGEMALELMKAIIGNIMIPILLVGVGLVLISAALWLVLAVILKVVNESAPASVPVEPVVIES